MSLSRDYSTDDATVASTVLQAQRIVFHRYRLERLVGRGGMGVVWLAQDEKLDRPVALKFLPEILFRDPAARDDLKRETRRSLELTHPHIVRIHDFIEDEETAAIAMEFVDGHNLSQLRVNRPSRVFEVDDLKIWTSALCAAIDYAHEAGRCVHRDLKPSNLMVSARGVLKIADFGIACGLHHTAARVSAWSSTGGTLGYMSPQQLLGELAAPSDDIYAIGATLYELLTGKPPFYSGDISAQIREVRPETMTVRRGQFGIPGAPIPDAWEQTIAACLSKHAHQRPRTARDVARQLGLPVATSAEIAASLGEDLAPTLRTEPEIASERTRPLAPPRPRKPLREIFAQYRWPILTALALIAAIAPWLIRHPSTPSSATAPVEAPEPAAPVAQVAEKPAQISAPPAAAPAPIVEKAPPLAPTAPPPAALAAVPSPAADRTFLSPESAPAAAPAASAPPIEILSNPPGMLVEVFAGVDETLDGEALQRGETPLTVAQLAPGAYRVRFSPAGMPPRSAALQVPEQGGGRVEQDFPRGLLKVRSQPAGAEIFCDERPIGIAPVEIPVLTGKHEIGARWQGRDARDRLITVTANGTETVAFDFRTSSAGTRSTARKPRKKEDDTLWEKMGRSINKIFTGDKKR